MKPRPNCSTCFGTGYGRHDYDKAPTHLDEKCHCWTATEPTEARPTPIERLRAVLCDPDGEVCIHGSLQDRVIVSAALLEIESEAADLRSQLAEARAKERWQPIATAPKDRLIDIWLATNFRLTDCYYDDICDEWRTSSSSGHLVCVKARVVTHWMERPADPEAIRALTDEAKP